MNSFFKITLFVTLLVSLGANAKILKEKYKPKATFSIVKWEVLDISFPIKTNLKSPFTARFGALFSHENGSTQEVPGFYNGNNEWIIRFSSSIEGEWTFVTFGEEKSSENLKGKVRITKNKANNPGAIVIPKEMPQNFFYQDGTPYFLLAFECDWLFALDYHNKKALPKTDHLLDLIKENGFNQVVMNVYTYDVSWEKDPKLKTHPEHEFGGMDDMFPFSGNNKKPDFSALNPEFFNKLDRTISLMHDKRIASHLMIYVWNKLVAWPDMNTEADNMYFDYVIKRYQAFPNIVWDISKEALFYGRADEKYINDRIERARKADKFNRLLSVHDFKFCAKYPENVDFISTQDWSDNLYNKMFEAKTKFKKPVFNIEHGGYEESPYVVFTGDYINAEHCIRRNYMCLFAGVYSTYYWQGASWNVVIYNPFEQPIDCIKPKFEYYKHLKKIFTDFDFTKLKPTPGKNGSGYCLTNDNGITLLYVNKENYGINAWHLKPEFGERTTQWFNVITGELTPEVDYDKNEKQISPWANKTDSILISRLKS
ncbi:protein of unknown function [Flavobacterium flevense]|uniref:DUF5060 domain-containing protein n=1 Tax=Flavobacterium flevense TaxID=983 RepID=A0A4Y4AYW8_9FLAO|nr:DUF5060 domain-containing protein [Flavobacterium flevense]GEC72509.1 hypothetical protein FFL01_20480 [Flavobacterium flevense]SHM13577.1 protein of unknown function [Flavobacterium flevense]